MNPFENFKTEPEFPNLSSYFLIAHEHNSTPKITRSVIASYTAAEEILTTGDCSINLIAKPNSNVYIYTTYVCNDNSEDLYTNAHDYTLPMSAPLRSNLNEFNSDIGEKVKRIATQNTNEDIYVSMTTQNYMHVRRWTDNSVIFEKRLTEV